ncbi:MAG: HPr family phosphocarrier protein, partial [Thermoleophilia bacterium]|nr:HPr family phosphocarrier protein [Thermoleophilia bacterium]
MVGLVLVCHSAKLAEGAAELAAQVAGGEVRIAVAGGLDRAAAPHATVGADGAAGADAVHGADTAHGSDAVRGAGAPRGNEAAVAIDGAVGADAGVATDAVLGTDAMLVRRAVEGVWSEDGVLVLMDLGSAVLSAEMALDLLPEERRARVRLVAAPFVEGAVAAAVAASLGDPLERVAEEAGAALDAKAAHLASPQTGGEATPEAATPARGAERPGAQPQPAGQPVAGTAGQSGPLPSAEPPGTLPPAGPSLRLTVDSRLGLHARPAALLVRTAAGFDADVTVTDVSAGRGPVSARSLNAVATLGARFGDELLLRASGPQAEEALAAIARLAAEGFGEPREARPTGPPTGLPGTAAGLGS